MIGAEAIATMTEEAVVEKLEIVAAAAIAADRIDRIEMNIRTFFVSVPDDRAGALGAIAGTIGVDAAMVEASPFALIGSSGSITDDLIARRERFGFSYIIVGADVLDSFAPVVAGLAGS